MTANAVREYTDADLRAMMPGTPASVARTLRAFHGDPAVKRKYLARVRAHAKADEIIHGIYWEGGKGCAVGCTIHSGDHSAYETEVGIPRVLARLEDGIFEALPNGDSKLWPGKFLASITPGTDLGMVWPQFAVWLLVDPKWGVFRHSRGSSKAAIQAVADAYQSVVSKTGKSIDWYKLRVDAADAAAVDAVVAAVAYATRQKACMAQADKLLELLKRAA
jgi:hypothetical protein